MKPEINLRHRQVPRISHKMVEDLPLSDVSKKTNGLVSVDTDRNHLTHISNNPTSVSFNNEEVDFDQDGDGELCRDSAPLLSASGDVNGGEETMATEKAETTIETRESFVTIALQIFFPYIIAGFGMVAAGMVLDHVQHWEVFQKVTEIFILVPSLLGLKGNLEMTLASRLSTQANLGNMDCRKEQFKMIGGNLALIQCQATVVGLLASLAAMVFGWIPKGIFDIHHAMLLCASSLITASLASAILGCLMIGVIITSRKCNINPDNVATPIAASLGDLVTLSLLSAISLALFHAIENYKWLAPTLIFLFLLLLPMWVFLAYENKYTHKVLHEGWTPVISAMVISSVGGLILDFAVSNFKGIAVFQPVINGVGGNLVAVQASRLSTTLHRTSTLGTLPEQLPHGCPNSCSTFCLSSSNSRTARVLLVLVIPGHLIFIYTIAYLRAGHTSITATFAVVYLLAAMLQVLTLLYVANWMVHYMWRRKVDPDNAAIPYLTAIGDLLGTGLLAIAFLFLFLIGDRDSDVGE